MKRLTKRSADGTAVWFVDHEKDGLELEPCEMEYRHSGMAIRRLAEYEYLEEQGRLLKLSCKTGNKLYWIADAGLDQTYELIEEVEVSVISFNGNSLQLWFSDEEEKEFPVLESSEIGKKLFFSYKDAEKAMKCVRRGLMKIHCGKNRKGEWKASLERSKLGEPDFIFSSDIDFFCNNGVYVIDTYSGFIARAFGSVNKAVEFLIKTEEKFRAKIVRVDVI